MSVRTDRVQLIVDIKGNEALNRLNDLKKQAADIKAEMGGLKKNTAEYMAKAKELAAVNRQMDDLKKTIGLAALSQKELTSELRRLTAIRNSVAPFSKEFKELDKQIKAVKDRLYDVKNGVQGFSSFWSKINDQVKQFGVLAAAYLGFDFISSQVKNLLTQNAKLSDQLAGIAQVTGLTSLEVENLNNKLKDLDTRTSTSQLRDIAIIAGKLGIAKDDIFDFTKAVDQLVVALGNDLGDADKITTELGKILNVFEGEITGDNISRLGNAIVDMANKGVASAPFLVDFTQRLAGLADTANVTLDSAIGLAAGLEETGIRSESGSTAIINILGQLGNNVQAFAKAAGKDVNEFAQTIQDRPVEALIQLAEGVVKNKKGLQELAPAFKELGIDGTRVQSVLGVIGGQADFFRTKIDDAGESLKSTSAITDAFNLKNQTFGAELEKLGKNINRLFTNSAVTSFFQGIVRAINNIITPTKTAVQQFDDMNKSVSNLETNVLPLANRYDELKSKTNLSKKEQQEMQRIVDQVAKTIPSAITQVDAYGKAIAISTQRVQEYVNTEKSRLRVVNAAAITEIDKELKKVNQQYEFLSKRVEERNKKGFFNVQVKGEDGILFSRKSTQQEIAELDANFRIVIDKRRGLNAELERLNGKALEKQLTDEEKARKAAEAAAKNVVVTSEKEDDKEAERRKERLKKLLEDAADFERDLQRLKDGVLNKTLSDNEQEVLAINQKYADLLEKARKYYSDLKELGFNAKDQLTREEILLEESKFAELNQLADKFQKQRAKDEEDRNDRNYKSALASQQENNAQLVQQYKQLYADQLIDKKEFERLQQQAVIDARKNELQVAKNWANKSKQAAQDVADFEKQLQIEITDAIIAENERRAEENEKLKKQREDAAEASKQAVMEQLQEMINFAQVAQGLFSSLDQINANRENAALARERRANDAKKQMYQKQLDQQLISKEQFDRKVAASDAEYERKEKEMRRRQAEREKKINLFQSFINTASAIVEALPNIPLSIFVGAAGFAQSAAIASTDIPEFEKGRWVRDGKRHSEGGIMAEIEKDEAVMSRRAMLNNDVVTVTGTTAQITSALNSRAGGASWAGGAVVQMPRWTSAAPPAINPSLPSIMEGGGRFRDGKAAVNRTDDGPAVSNELLRQVVASQLQTAEEIRTMKRELKAVVVYKEITDAGDRLDAAKKAGAL